MGKSEKQMDKEQGRNQRIIDTAFRLFVEKKIEAVSMDEVAKEAGVGRATLFRCYNNKTELAIAVCAKRVPSGPTAFCRRGSTSQTGTLPAAIMLGLVVTPASG